MDSHELLIPEADQPHICGAPFPLADGTALPGVACLRFRGHQSVHGFTLLWKLSETDGGFRVDRWLRDPLAGGGPVGRAAELLVLNEQADA